MSTSRISRILNKKEKIVLSVTTTTKTSATRIGHSRNNNTIQETKKRRSIWIDDEIEFNKLL